MGQKIEKSALKLRQSLFKPYKRQDRVCNRVRDKKCFELEIHEKFDEIIHRRYFGPRINKEGKPLLQKALVSSFYVLLDQRVDSLTVIYRLTRPQKT